MRETRAVAVDVAWGAAGTAGGDEQLIAQAGRGDHAAFERLVESRSHALLRTARAILGNETDAYEAAQETLIAAWIHLPGLRDAGRFDAWLTQSLRNKCRDALRRRKRVREIDLAGASLPGPDVAAARIEHAAILAAFDRLSIDDRHILVLHHLHALPLRDVASQLRVNVGTAKSRLWRARRALERALEAES